MLGEVAENKSFGLSGANFSGRRRVFQNSCRVDEIFAEYKDGKIDCALLGCASMAGLDEKLLELYSGVVLVDSVKVGVEFLLALIRKS